MSAVPDVGAVILERISREGTFPRSIVPHNAKHFALLHIE